MNQAATSILALAAILAAPCALADEALYLGATLGQRTELTLQAGGQRQSDASEPRAFGIVGGYDFSEHLAIEAGYTSFGTHRYASGASIRMGALHVAAKGGFALNDKFSLFGKAGLVRHTLKLAGTGEDDGSHSKARPMFGAGAAYRLTEKVGVTLEVVDYGTLRTGAGEIKVRQFEAGLHVKF